MKCYLTACILQQSQRSQDSVNLVRKLKNESLKD